MVPTRGDRYKFTDGEKVLCYEPDPSKAKVLYDSKVLAVIADCDGKGRKQTEYLIHFQGWNASWDRKVPEEFVLKDIEENRKLQTELAEKSQIKLSIKSNRVLIGAGSQLGDRKRRRRLSETIRETIERERQERAESESSQTTGTTDDDVASFASEAEESTQNVENEGESDDETFNKFAPLTIPNPLKEILEKDFRFVNESNKLVNLPSSKSILCILEDYVKFFAIRHITKGKEKRKSSIEKERAYMTLDLCKEIMDGFRICFDFYVNTLLLYPSERKQAEKLKNVTNINPILSKYFNEKMTLRGKENKFEKVNVPEKETKDVEESNARRVLRSKRSLSELSMPTSEKETKMSQTALSESGRSTPTTVTSENSLISSLKFPIDLELLNYPIKIDGVYHDLKNWTLLPEEFKTPPSPIMIYGPIHLLRLFVKFPEILYRMNVTDDRKKIILKHADLFLKYLNLHIDELFKESDYINAKT